MNQLQAALPAADKNTAQAPADAFQDLTLPQFHNLLTEAGLQSTPETVKKQSNISAALRRWFGGWSFMSVNGLISHAYLANTAGFVVIGPYFYAVPKYIATTEPTRR
ncbi:MULTISPECIES: hypothetical protein [unclassified Leifsonia]|uniref:hypothetical protein n=1 Tax=unclassified Leifsonia TaxID=2663824 RepID=UPI0006F245F7|nr:MULTISPECIES: hypothetical protein [unclassified Leifsonia]KQX07755.1 hypothetical protein ASC59_08490 [Leifsonia sp. Root1293]KRA12037.1 hypothetical protein ASD61_08490 [Leifsonia sp. Root60]